MCRTRLHHARAGHLSRRGQRRQCASGGGDLLRGGSVDCVSWGGDDFSAQSRIPDHSSPHSSPMPTAFSLRRRVDKHGCTTALDASDDTNEQHQSTSFRATAIRRRTAQPPPRPLSDGALGGRTGHHDRDRRTEHPDRNRSPRRDRRPRRQRHPSWPRRQRRSLRRRRPGQADRRRRPRQAAGPGRAATSARAGRSETSQGSAKLAHDLTREGT